MSRRVRTLVLPASIGLAVATLSLVMMTPSYADEPTTPTPSPTLTVPTVRSSTGIITHPNGACVNCV